MIRMPREDSDRWSIVKENCSEVAVGQSDRLADLFFRCCWVLIVKLFLHSSLDCVMLSGVLKPLQI